MTVLTTQTKARLMREGLKKLYMDSETTKKRDAVHKALNELEGDDETAANLYDAIKELP